MYGSTALSAKQAKILAFIEKEIARLGRPPSLRDIAEYFGYSAVGTVQDHIKALIKKGFLEQDSSAVPTPHTTKQKRQARSLRLTHRSSSMDVPILGTVPAGRPIEAIEDRQGALSIPGRFKGELFALKIKGESMIEAGILDGDLVVVRKQNTANNGQIVVAMIDGEATVKYLEKKATGLRLLPANSKMSPIPVPDHAANSDDFIQGVVVSLQRFLI